MADSRLARMGETYEQYKDRRVGDKRMAHERKAVRCLLHALGLSTSLLALIRRVNEADDSILTLGWFHEHYPTFPMKLTANDIELTSLDDFMRSPKSRNNNIWTAWKNTIEDIGDTSLAIGSVVQYNDELWLLHNLDIPYIGVDENEHFARLHRVMPNGQHITFERLKVFAIRVLHIWGPT